MTTDHLALDVRGMLEAENLLALLDLPLAKRKRLLNNVSKRVRTLSRQRIRNQQNVDGTPFAPRKAPPRARRRWKRASASSSRSPG